MKTIIVCKIKNTSKTFKIPKALSLCIVNQKIQNIKVLCILLGDQEFMEFRWVLGHLALELFFALMFCCKATLLPYLRYSSTYSTMLTPKK